MARSIDLKNFTRAFELYSSRNDRKNKIFVNNLKFFHKKQFFSIDHFVRNKNFDQFFGHYIYSSIVIIFFDLWIRDFKRYSLSYRQTPLFGGPRGVRLRDQGNPKCFKKSRRLFNYIKFCNCTYFYLLIK